MRRRKGDGEGNRKRGRRGVCVRERKKERKIDR